jgi:hypothetical protein
MEPLLNVMTDRDAMVAGRRAVLLIAAWVLADIVVRLAIDPLAILHDQALYIECGRRIALGQLPYRDFFDINPPLIMYLNAVPALLARMAGVNPVPVFTIALALLSGWSAWAAVRIAQPLIGASFLDRLILLMVPLGPCALAAWKMDTGQREHLFVLLYYPFFVLRVVRSMTPPARSRHGSFWYGVAAGVGVCIKPHFVLPALCVEAVLLLRRRASKHLAAPEVFGAIAFASVYAIHFLLWPASMRDGFFHRVVPLVWFGYSAYDVPVLVFLPFVLRGLARAGLFTTLALVTRKYALRVFAWPAAAFTAGSLVSAALQHKGWTYHYLPADAGSVLLLGIAAASLKTRALAWNVRAGRAWATVTAGLILAVLFAWPAHHQRRSIGLYSFHTMLERYTAPGDGAVVVSTSVSDAYPAVLQTGRHLVTRHLWGGMLALAFRAEEGGFSGAAEQRRRFLEETAADIERNRPRAVFLDDRAPCLGCPAGFRVSAYALADPGIRRALIGYLARGTDQGFVVFTRPD